MTDEKIAKHIEWAARPTRGLKGIRLQMSANIDPLKPGDLPIGEAVEFRATTRRDYVAAAHRKLKWRVVARYRKFNGE